MPSANMASESSMRMTFDFVFLESLAPIWAPIAERDDWSAFHAKLAGIDVARRAYDLS